jgi:hypothetical protein
MSGNDRSGRVRQGHDCQLGLPEVTHCHRFAPSTLLAWGRAGEPGGRELILFSQLRRSRQRHLVGAALAAGMLLASCSSGSDSSDGDSTDGGEATEDVRNDGGDSSESPSSTPTPSPADIDRPEIELPDGMNHAFEDTETGDATHDAIIADVTRWIQAVDAGIAVGDPEYGAMDFYATGEGLTSSRQLVRGAVEDGRSWGGTITFYRFTVDNESGDMANSPAVSYCRDFTETRDVDRQSGETAPPPTDNEPAYLYTAVRVTQNDQGVWQVNLVVPPYPELNELCER